MIKGMHHASITTGDVDKLTRFYCELFGFTVVMQYTWEAGNTMADHIYGLRDSAVNMVMLRTDNAFLELFEFKHPKGKSNDPERPVCDQGYTHVCIVVSDIDAEYRRLEAAGMRFNCPPQHLPGLCSATYGRDPDGNIIELMEPDPAGPFNF